MECKGRVHNYKGAMGQRQVFSFFPLKSAIQSMSDIANKLTEFRTNFPREILGYYFPKIGCVFVINRVIHISTGGGPFSQLSENVGHEIHQICQNLNFLTLSALGKKINTLNEWTISPVGSEWCIYDIAIQGSKFRYTNIPNNNTASAPDA